MSQFNKFITTFALFNVLACFSAFAGEDSQVTDAAKTIAVEQSKPEFTITLKSNPTTGYTWLVKDFDAHFVTVVGHKYQAAKTNLVGAGGTDVWTFKLNEQAFTAPHLLTIKMVYAKAWDVKDNATEQEFMVTTH